MNKEIFLIVFAFPIKLNLSIISSFINIIYILSFLELILLYILLFNPNLIIKKLLLSLI
jgi:hypothetical protein